MAIFFVLARSVSSRAFKHAPVPRSLRTLEMSHSSTPFLFFSVCFLILVLTFPALAVSDTKEAAAIEGMFLSLKGKELEEQRRILRQITLFSTTKEIREEVAIPKMAEILLDPKASEVLRREAAKSILTMAGEKRLARPFVPLLQKNKITIEEAIEAIWLTGEPMFLSALVSLVMAKDVDPTLQRRSMNTALSLWDINVCDLRFEPLAKPAKPRVPINPALAPLKESTPKQTPSYPGKRTLWSLAKERSNANQLKALLVLGCLGEERAIKILVEKKYRGANRKTRNLINELSHRSSNDKTSK